MARHGENIRKRKDGRWEGRFMIYSKEKKKKIYRSVYAPSYDEVRKKLAVQKNMLSNDVSGVMNSITLCNIKFSDMAEEWLEMVKKCRKPSTYNKYSIVYHYHIKHCFKDTSLFDISDAVLSQKIFDHLSESVSNSIYCVLNQILKFISAKYSITLPELKKTAFSIQLKAVKTFTWNEQKRLVTVLYQETDLFKRAVLLCLFTGLRLGELCALKWSDIDCENSTLTVNRTVQRLYAEGYKTLTVLTESVPKSEYSRREIPLSDVVLEILSKNKNDKEYIFGEDKPLEPRTVQYHFKKILKEAGVADKNFHVLRHTFSTNCIERGIDVKSLSEILGHSDVQITLNRYVHPSMDIKRQHMNELSAFYGQISGQKKQHS